MELEGKQCRHFPCICSSEMIQIEADYHWNKQKDGTRKRVLCGVDFAIYLHGITNHEYCLKERLRHIWQILIHKTPYSDFAILSVEDARRMGYTLLKMTEEEK